MNTPRQSRARALTLLEVVCAIVLIAVAAPALLTAVRDATVRRASVQQQVVARWLITEKLETITADRHSASRGWSFITAANYPPETAVTGFAPFARTTAITETGPDLVTPGTGYRRVTVSVTYADVHQGSRTISISTVLTDYDQ